MEFDSVAKISLVYPAILPSQGTGKSLLNTSTQRSHKPVTESIHYGYMHKQGQREVILYSIFFLSLRLSMRMYPLREVDALTSHNITARL